MSLLKLASCSATCILLLLAGSIFAIGVLARAAVSDRIWEASFSTMALISAPAMILSGLYLDRSKHRRDADESEKTKKTRMLIWLSSFAFAVLSLGSLPSPTMIRLAVSVQGIPLGILFLLGNELLGDWMANSPGMGIGLGQMAFCMGTIVFSSVFSTLFTLLGSGAIVVSGLSLAIPTFILSFLITYPDRRHVRSLQTQKSAVGEFAGSLLTETGVKLSWQKLISERSFWFYNLLVFTAQAGFSFVPLFFKLGTSFGGSLETVVRLFQMANFLSTCARLGAGLLTDSFGFLCSNRFSSGSKNLLQLLFAIQATILALLVWLSKTVNFYGSMFAATAIIVTYSAANCSCALLARDMFSSENSSTVFGVGAGLMMGVGEAVSSGIGSWLVGRYGAGPYDTGFPILYVVLCLWSSAGFFVAALTTRCELAFWRSPHVSYTSESELVEVTAIKLEDEIIEERTEIQPLFSKCDSALKSRTVNVDFRVTVPV